MKRMRSTTRRLDSSLIALIAEGFFSRLSFGVISFALPLYARHLGMTLAEIGVLASLNVAVTMAMKPAMGYAADYVGLKRSLTAAIGLRSLVSLAFALAGSPWQLYAIRGAHGATMSLRDPSVNALLAHHGGEKAVASAFAWYSTAKSVAGSLGKAAAGVLLTLTATNFTFVFLVALVLSALPLYVVARYIPGGGLTHHPPVAPAGDPIAERNAQDGTSAIPGTARRPGLAPFMGLAFLISSTGAMLHNLFPILATEYAGLSEAETGAIYGFSTVVILVSGPVFGWLSDNVSRRLVFLVRGAANILSSVVYLVAPDFMGMACGRVVDDMGKAAFRPAWGAVMAYLSSFDPRRRARTMGIVSLGEDAGEIAGPVLAGLLWSTWGVATLFGIRILMAVVAEIYTLALTGRLGREPRNRAAIEVVSAQRDALS